MKKFICFILFFLLSVCVSYAQDPKVLEYNKDSKTIKVEIEGKEYTLDVPQEEAATTTTEETTIPEEITLEDETNPELTGTAKKKVKYARGPAAANVGARLYNIPTDNLLPRGGLLFDFTHRFSGAIDMSTNKDVYGLDTFAYTGFGLYYGITNFLEAHVFRTSLTDAIEAGLKYQLFKEAKEHGAPFGLTLSSGFQNDNIQNSIDFYLQPILSKVIIPSWLKVYLAPTWAFRSATLGRPDSASAIFFPFSDPKGRGYFREHGTFALPIGAALQVLPDRLALFGEYTPVLNGYKEVENGWSFGLKILSKLETHVWTIGISNVPYSTFGQFIVGAPNNDWHVGFNITARMK